MYGARIGRMRIWNQQNTKVKTPNTKDVKTRSHRDGYQEWDKDLCTMPELLPLLNTSPILGYTKKTLPILNHLMGHYMGPNPNFLIFLIRYPTKIIAS